MSKKDEIKKCSDDGNCVILLYELRGCPHCEDMKKELEGDRIDYILRRATKELARETGIHTAPQLHVITKDDVDIITSKKELKTF